MQAACRCRPQPRTAAPHKQEYNDVDGALHHVLSATMNSIDLFQNPLRRWGKHKDGKHRPTVLVKELQERDRRRMVKHFLELESADRLLRFGTMLPDEQVEKYVNQIDFSRDMVLSLIHI